METQNSNNSNVDSGSQTPSTPIKSANPSWWEIIKFAVITAAIVLPIRAFIAQPFIVSGASMEPNFYDHEYLIVDELSYLLRSPKRGEVVIFRFPENPKMFFIKRVIGLPGETVDIANSKITITSADGKSQTLDEPYAEGVTMTEVNHLKLGTDEYFVAGDHREVSYDSRRWGPVKIDLIKGRAWLRLLPPTKISYLPADGTNLNPAK
ncbi:MAG: signal peptidase I [Candidatus Paceibacterota bacterium]|jgi:signal peptidase I